MIAPADRNQVILFLVMGIVMTVICIGVLVLLAARMKAAPGGLKVLFVLGIVLAGSMGLGGCFASCGMAAALLSNNR